MADRTPRKSATRDSETRRKPWAPPSHLEAPEAPEGYVHRWIRVAMRGEEDKMNVHSKLREGWEPVRADEYPNYEAPVIDDGKYQGVIGQGGLMLCRIPEETVIERTAYYGGRTREQMTAVDQDLMKEQHPSMRGEEDKMNVHSKLREGWEPVRADEYPDYEAPVIDDGKYQGVIGQGGLMLCRIPEETVIERTAYYGGRTREQMTAVDQDLMKEQHPSMPIQNSRQSRVTFGGRERDSE